MVYPIIRTTLTLRQIIPQAESLNKESTIDLNFLKHHSPAHNVCIGTGIF